MKYRLPGTAGVVTLAIVVALLVATGAPPILWISTTGIIGFAMFTAIRFSATDAARLNHEHTYRSPTGMLSSMTSQLNVSLRVKVRAFLIAMAARFQHAFHPPCLQIRCA